jgi:sulfur dioxygenase
MGMNFRQINPHGCKTYLVGSPGGPEVALIDPDLGCLARYLELLEGEALTLVQVVDTHAHADHLSAGPALRDATNCSYAMHADSRVSCVTERLRDGMQLDLGGIPAQVMHTPGHTADSISLILADRLLTGDALFLDDGGAGRDDLPGGDPAEHWDTLRRLLTLPDHLVVHPGHDYRNRAPSTLARQQERNPHLRPRTREEFVRYVQELKLGPADWMVNVLKANYAGTRDPEAATIPKDVPACEVQGTLDPGLEKIQVRHITVEVLRDRMQADDAPVLLDVRDVAELRGELGHLPGVHHVPVDRLSGELSNLREHQEREIVTICRSGGRAATAARMLEGAGFSRVSVLEGGMMAWGAAGHPVKNRRDLK